MVSKEGVALATGIICIAIGVLFTLTWDHLVEAQVAKEFILTDSSKTYEAFVKTRIPMYIKFHFWNWTNPSDFRDPDYKANLTEMGPYVYREVIEKTDIIWNKNGTVTYRRVHRWYYVPEMSNGSLDDNVTTINVVAMSAAFMTRGENVLMRMGLNAGLSATQTMAVTKPVRELLFEGYSDPLISTVKNFKFIAGDIPFDRFGWFYKRNGTVDNDGVFNVETGTNGMDTFGKIRNWNYKNQTPFYADECGQVRGSGGEFFPPKRTKTDILELFSADLCRFVTFKFTKETEMYGVKLYKYETRSTLFDNGEEDPANSCFCASEECAPSGVLNVSACRLGAPAYVSYPHFYMGDSELRDAVIGMKPDPSKHGGHIIMEPTWGVPFSVRARAQINILIEPHSDIHMYNGVKKTYFPMIWFEQTAEITPDTVDVINTLLILPVVGLVVGVIFLAGGITAVSAIAISRYCRKEKKININYTQEKQTEPLNGAVYRNAETISQWDTKL